LVFARDAQQVIGAARRKLRQFKSGWLVRIALVTIRNCRRLLSVRA
jgi:hypothetical protein